MQTNPEEKEHITNQVFFLPYIDEMPNWFAPAMQAALAPVHQEVQALRQEFRQEVQALHQEFRQEVWALRREFCREVCNIKDTLYDVRITLLKARAFIYLLLLYANHCLWS